MRVGLWRSPGRPGAAGVYINQNALDTVGGTAAADRNVISGAEQYRNPRLLRLSGRDQGQLHRDPVTTGTKSIRGTDRRLGVVLTDGSHQVTVGGTGAGDLNVISGNQREGVSISGKLGELSRQLGRGQSDFGTDLNRSLAIPNGVGISLSGGASNNTVGGATATGKRHLREHRRRNRHHRRGHDGESLWRATTSAPTRPGTTGLPNRFGPKLVRSTTELIQEACNLASNLGIFLGPKRISAKKKMKTISPEKPKFISSYHNAGRGYGLLASASYRLAWR